MIIPIIKCEKWSTSGLLIQVVDIINDTPKLVNPCKGQSQILLLTNFSFAKRHDLHFLEFEKSEQIV